MDITPTIRELLTLVIMLSLVAAGPVMAKRRPRVKSQVLYPAGSQGTFTGPEKWFTGDVKVDMVFPANETAHYSAATVHFSPGARTAWHLHPAGQHMVVTSGICLTGTRDGKILKFGPGEAVWCPKNVDHWHGATPHRAMTHLVITGSRKGKAVIWKEKVTDAQYLGEERTMGERKSLSARQRAFVPIAAFTAAGDLKGLKKACEEGLAAGLTINEIKEIPVHLYAYAGFPRALNALGTFMAVVDERRSKGLRDEEGKDASPLPAGDDSLERGEAVQTRLAGRKVAGPLFDFAPVINDYLKSHLFGDIFGRDVLSHEDREVVTVAALSAMEGVEPQLGAHVGISMNAGLSEAQLKDLADLLEKKVGEDVAGRARSVMKRVLTR